MSAHDDEFPATGHSNEDWRRRTRPKYWEGNNMRTATTPISTEILRDALGFPDDVEIVGEIDGNINLTVRSERIPEGASEVIATWIRTDGRDPEFRSFDPMRGRPALAGDEPPTKAEPVLKSWRVLTPDSCWITVAGEAIRRDLDCVEIVGPGTRHVFHRPQAVEQIQ